MVLCHGNGLGLNAATSSSADRPRERGVNHQGSGRRISSSRLVFFEGADSNLRVRQAKPSSDIQGGSGAPQSDLLPGYSEDALKITFLSPDPKQH